MKPPVFEYHAPGSVDEALTLLAERGEDGKVLAGGQSLVPLLNFRLAHPENLFDINRLGELTGIRRRNGRLKIGAMTRQSSLAGSAIAADGWPLLIEAIGFVAHAQIRNRGTVGGSVAHADPAAELPAAMAALEAEAVVRSVRGERRIPASELFLTHLTTTLETDELLTRLELEPLPAHTGHAFVEFSRRHGDFALGGAAILVGEDGDGRCEWARIALLGAASTPIRATAAESALAGAEIDEQTAADAAALAVEGIEPTGDIHGSSEYRVDLIRVLVRRGILAASERAKGSYRNGGKA